MAIRDLTQVFKEQNKEIAKKTYTVKELSEALNISEGKARQLTHAEGFPVLVLGRTRLTIISKLDKWLEENVGGDFL